MNWHKANQALSNIRRLLKVFENSEGLSAIERDLLLRRIQDLYEVVLESDTSFLSDVKVSNPAKPLTPTPPSPETTTPKVVQTPKSEVPKVVEPPKNTTPIINRPEPIEKPHVTVERPKAPEIQLPKREVRKPIEIRKSTPPVATSLSAEEQEMIHSLFEFKTASDLSEKLSESPIHDLTTSMSINELFITVSELFKGNKPKYDEAIHKLNSFDSFEQAKNYMLNELIAEYDWLNKKKLKSAKDFIKKVRRRYL